jgi:hypothetical protein
MMKDYKFDCYHSENLFKKILDDECLKSGVLGKNTIIESNLVNYSVDEIIESLSSLSKKLIKNKKTADIISNYDLGFLIAFLRKKNLTNLINLNFNNKELLDLESNIQGNKSIFLQPKGVLVHWISGNMPVLGFISLICGLVTKNINIIKLPSSSISEFLDLFKLITTENDFKSEQYLFNSVIPLSIDKINEKELNMLSRIADTRIFWGGKEGMDKITSLSRKIDANDLIMGPKLSSVIASSSYLLKLNPSSRQEIMNNIVKDVVTGNQRGCNSPHFIYLIGEESLSEKAKLLEELERSFKKILRKKNNNNISSIQKFKSIEETFNFISQDKGSVKGLINDNFKIFLYKNISSLRSFKSPLYGNTIFVQSCSFVEDILVQSNPQTISLAVADEDLNHIKKRLIKMGFLRIVKPGAMSAYDHPWDGMMPLTHLVKYIEISA